MGVAIQDIRFAVRQLLRSPGFALTSVLSLMLGIGATAAVFSVIYAVLFDPFPFPSADRIVRLSVRKSNGEGRNIGLNGPQIQELRQSPVISSLLVIDNWGLTLTGADLPEDVEADYLSSNSFDDLGVAPVLGRGIFPSDAPPGKEPQPVVVLSWNFWQRHYSGSRTALGQTLELDHKKYTIVGAMPPRFKWYSGDVYLPLKLTQDPGPTYTVNLLLRPGVTRAAANAALQPVLERFALQTPRRFPEHFRMEVQGLNDWVVKSLGGTLYLLFGAVALFLVIGCGNVSILLLARGTARQHELAVRAALGARRGRVVRQLLTESLLLAIVGAGLGIGLAFGILKLIVLLLPKYSFAPEVAIRINVPVLAFSVAVALVTGLLFGLWPAIQLSRPQISQSMQGVTRRIAGSVHGRRTHGALIAGQIALTMILLAGAGGAIQAFIRLMHTPLGFDPHNVLPIPIPLHDQEFKTWAERAPYFDRLRSSLAQVPGVSEAAIATHAVPPDNGSDMHYEILGRSTTQDASVRVNLVSPEYFSTLRIPLDKGRLWTEPENREGAHVAIVNEALARLLFPRGDALSQSIKLPQIEARSTIVLAAPGIADAWLQIVGIAADARNDGLRNPVKPAIYIPETLVLGEWTQILVRTQSSPAAMLHSIQKQIATVNPDQQTANNIEELEQWIVEEPDWAQEHLVAWIFASFAALALALAAVGLYSVVSYSVAQRTNEFGIRMALGAQRGHVLRIVFASVASNVGAGIAVGVLLALSSNRILAHWSAGTSNSPLILAAVSILLAAVAAAASAVPARRAVSTDPMTALRCE